MDFWAQWETLEVVMHSVLAVMASALAEVVVVRAHVRELVVAAGVVEGEFLESFQGEAGSGDKSSPEAEGVM